MVDYVACVRGILRSLGFESSGVRFEDWDCEELNRARRSMAYGINRTQN